MHVYTYRNLARVLEPQETEELHAESDKQYFTRHTTTSALINFIARDQNKCAQKYFLKSYVAYQTLE